ncbi:MAG: 50S ribosomal protein L25 [Muribaculaceae bacterium]|nr:50S ribosomal protein L25 [Muribaculaceae bacterium]
MKTFQLSAEPRTDLGKKATKALRALDKIPAVINGGEIVNLNEKGEYEGTLEPGQKVVKVNTAGKAVITTDITVAKDAVRKLIYTPEIFDIDLSINGKVQKAVLKDIQFHPLNDSILHIDFLAVNKEKPIVMEVPLAIEGHAVGVKAGGKLVLNMKKVKVKGIYTEIPERIVINVEPLQIGQAVMVGDLHYDNFEMASPKDLMIVSVRATRAAAAAAAETEEEAAE